MASLYSIKPNPFISLISVISPVPWVLKWFSTSALVATVHGVQSANSEEVSECRPSSPGSSSDSDDDGPMPGGLSAGECRVARDGSKSDRNEAPM